MRQVIHALLTRPPLSQSSVRKLPLNRFVRLACVKHAASVHPEPGSNSHVQKVKTFKFDLARISGLLFIPKSELTVFKGSLKFQRSSHLHFVVAE